MEITPDQFAKVEHCLPKQRGNVRLSSLQVFNAILYVAEHQCKWCELPERFGSWGAIYMRMNRWANSGVLDRAFEQLRQAEVVHIKMEKVWVDRTAVKVGSSRKRTPQKAVCRLAVDPLIA